MSNPLLVAVLNHLWQSTLFAVAVGGLTLLLRQNSARVRYSLWLIASLKFLVPFALLAAIGSQIPWDAGGSSHETVAPRVFILAGDLAMPITPTARIAETPNINSVAIGLLFPALTIAWALGAMAIAGRWLRRWMQIRRVMRESQTISGIEFPVPVRSASTQLEPGVLGIRRPLLLLPAGMETLLTADEMRAVLAHEACHLKRRDNFSAALHMAVEMLFWFHPLVWWIGARLLEERERACDEQVLRDGHAPESYAEAILKVCEHYVASRLPCVAGVSGSDLRKRIEGIIRSPRISRLSRSKRFALAAIACIALVMPIAAGVVSARMGASSQHQVAEERFYGAVSAWAGGGVCPGRSAKVIEKQTELAKSLSWLSATNEKRALTYAVVANSVAEVQRLLAAGAPRDDDAGTLLHAAARFGDAPMLEVLVGAGFGLEDLGTSAATALAVAAGDGRKENVGWLIAHGADVNSRGRNGVSVLTYAALCKDQDLMDMLVRAGARPDTRSRLVAAKTGVELPSVSAPARADELLQGWRALTQEELNKLPVRNDSPTKFARAAADFDGDGKLDEAVILVATDESIQGLFVKLSSQSGDWTLAIHEPHKPQSPLVWGIDVQKPGTIDAACAKGYLPCNPDEPRLFLKHPGIRYFQFEGSAAIVYWDSAARNFKQAWYSD
ncbi:MAG: M56 family metallopeptidase [Pseudomonadota bacterium]